MRSIVAASTVIMLLALVTSASEVHGENVPIAGPTFLQGGETVTVAGVTSTYFYAGSGGGAANYTSSDFTSDLQVRSQEGFNTLVIGHSSTRTGTMVNNGPQGPSVYRVFGGMGANFSSFEMKKYWNVAQTTISDSFTLSAATVVILVAASSNEVQFLSLTGPLSVDGSSVDGGALVFAHGSLGAGTYSFSLSFSPWSDTAARTMGVVLYVVTTPSPAAPLGLEPSTLFLVFGLVAAGIIGAVATFVIMRTRNKRITKAPIGST